MSTVSYVLNTVSREYSEHFISKDIFNMSHMSHITDIMSHFIEHYKLLKCVPVLRIVRLVRISSTLGTRYNHVRIDVKT